MKYGLLFYVLIAFYSCATHYTAPAIPKGLLAGKINGMALAATPNPYKDDPMINIQKLGANWISLQPFAFFYKNQPVIQYGGNYQWWGNNLAGIAKSIELAKNNNLKIMLKPQLWAYNQWVGDLAFEKEAGWLEFETNYRNFILPLAKLADSLEVDLFAVGTEVKLSALKRPEYWRRLIREIRTIYKGKLIYASNWDGYHALTFWDELDYIGIDAYFPLTKKKNPSLEELKKAWQPTIDSLQDFYTQWQRPIIFTEFGYMSLEGTAYRAWELEKVRAQTKNSEEAQLLALLALLETFGQKDWWAGGFQWIWYADIHQILNKNEAAKDYTPQGKKAAKMLSEIYQTAD